MSSIAAMFHLTGFALRRRLFGWQALASTAVALVPTLVALIAAGEIRSGNEQVPKPYELYGEFLAPVCLYCVLPFLSMLTMLPVVGSLYDRGAIGYLFTRPTPRWSLLLGLYKGGLLAMLPIMLVASVVPALVLMPLSHGIEFRFWLQRVAYLSAILWIGSAAYGALCMFLGVWSKKALLWALGLLIGWGVIAGSLTGPLREISLHRYLLGLMRNWLAVDNAWTGFFVPDRDPPSSVQAVLVLALGTLIFLAMAVRAMHKRDVL